MGWDWNLWEKCCSQTLDPRSQLRRRQRQRCQLRRLSRHDAKLPLVDADIYHALRPAPARVDMAEQMQGTGAGAVPRQQRVVTQHEAPRADVELEQVVHRRPGQLGNPVVIVVAADEVLSAGDGVEHAFGVGALGVAAACGEVAQVPVVIVGADAGSPSHHGRVHVVGAAEGPAEELPHIVVAEMRVGREVMRHGPALLMFAPPRPLPPWTLTHDKSDKLS